MRRAIGLFLSSMTLALSVGSGGRAESLPQDVIVTGPNEAAQVVLGDGTTLALGPQTEVAIDRFVYDPDSGAGDLIINARQGVLRFMGGRITASTAAVIATPASTLTIRGGALVQVTPDATSAIFVGGEEMKVVALGETRTVARPGWQATTLAGRPPGRAVPVAPGILAIELAEFDALPGGDRDRSIIEQAADATERGEPTGLSDAPSTTR